VKVEPLTDWPEHLDAGAVVHLEGEDTALTILRAERGGRVPALTLEGIDTREAAERLAGRYLEADAAPLPPGEYYWHQLEGLRVEDEGGTELGRIREVFRAGGAEVYAVLQPDGGELLVPGIRDVVRAIDIERGRMVIRYDVEEVGGG